MTIAITGASGQLGRIVVTQLKEKVPLADIVALARSVEKISELGVTARAADYAKPETLGPALKDVETLLLISSSEIGQRATQHANVIAAAQAAGVKRIVYTSLLRADTSSLSLAGEHVETEAALKASGLDYTILRNGWYTENYLASVPPALEHGAFIGAAGEGKISSASRVDYAAAAVAVLTSVGHSGKTYELSGDAAYTLTDLAAELSAQSGKDVPYVNMPEADYAQALIGAGLPDFLAAAFASFDAEAAKGVLYDEGTTLSELIGRPTTPLADALKAML